MLPPLLFVRLLLGIALLFPLKLLGAVPVTPQAESAVPQTEPAAPQAEQLAPQIKQSGSFDAVEAQRDYLSEKVISFAGYLDHFFGGDRHYQESNASVFQLDLTRVAGYGGDSKPYLAGRLNLRLPATEGRFRLLLETDPEENITSEPTQGQPARQTKAATSQNIALAARYATAKENVWHFSLDGGLKLPLPITPFVRTRGSFSAPLGKWRMKVAESVYWFNTSGAGADTQLDMEHVLGAKTLFRASGNATWSDVKQNFDVHQSLSIYHALNDRTALLYQVGATEVSNPQYQVTDYVALLFCRYRLHQEWLFFEISPQLHFPRVNNFKSTTALSLRLEALFDESR